MSRSPPLNVSGLTEAGAQSGRDSRSVGVGLGGAFLVAAESSQRQLMACVPRQRLRAAGLRFVVSESAGWG